MATAPDLPWKEIVLLTALLGVAVLLGSRLFSRVSARAPRTVRWTRMALFTVVLAGVVHVSLRSGLQLGPNSAPSTSGANSVSINLEPPPPRQLEISPRRSSEELSADEFTYTFVYRVPDSFEDWKRSLIDFDEFEPAARNRGVPSWVLTAAGSTYDRLEVAGKVLIESRAPGESNALVGYGMQEPDPKDAETRAFRSASEQLVAAIVWRIRDSTENLHNAAELAREVTFEQQEALRDGAFTESSQLPISGEKFFWSAVRLKADKATLDMLSRAVEKGLESGRLQEIRTHRALVAKLFSAFGLALCAFLIYCFLNAGTKGHFAWPLRIISFGGLIVILVLAFNA